MLNTSLTPSLLVNDIDKDVIDIRDFEKFILSQKTWSSLRAVGPTLRAGSWARSETIGYAMNPAASGTGMMEYWNVGMLKTRV